jgi:uncharacterized membrane protein
MLGKLMPLSRIVMIMAVAALVIGIVFIYQGVSKANMITEQMREENVSTAVLLGGNATAVVLIDSAGEAQRAADRVKEHRHGLVASYADLGRYNPGNQTHLSYTQALNLENYLYMGVLSLGFTQAVTVIGVFMILVGIALMAVWAARRKKKAAEVKAKST